MRTQLFASSKRAPFSVCVVANRGRIFRVCDFGCTHFFILEEKMDNFWVNKWRSKVTKTRLSLIAVGVFIFLIIALLDGIEQLLQSLPILIIITTVLILLSIAIRINVRVIDNYTICVYSGVITNILVIEGKEYARCTFSNDYLYGELPDGRQVCVKKSWLTGNIKISVGTNNDFNILL